MKDGNSPASPYTLSKPETIGPRAILINVPLEELDSLLEVAEVLCLKLLFLNLECRFAVSAKHKKGMHGQDEPP